jgi:peptidyl-prolyl cis-trans isomerase C
VTKKFAESDPTQEIPEADAQKFYDEHKDDFVKPARVRLAGLLVAATDADRAAKSAQAKKVFAQVKAAEKKDPNALQALARTASDDAATKTAGGDLGFRSQDEYAKQYGPAFAAAAFSAKDGEDVLVEAPQGFWIIRITGRQEGITRTFDQVKVQIQSRLQREKRTRDFDQYVKALRDEAKVTVNDAELEKVTVSTTPAGPPHMMPPGMPAGGMPAGPMPPRSHSPAAPPPAQK